MNTVSCAISPCPNDTYIFYALASGLIECPIHLEMTYADIETLNRAALLGTYDITKLSFFAWLFVRETYTLLDAGAALGLGCGPLVIAKKNNISIDKKIRVAVPGEYTTAHMLFRMKYPDAVNIVCCPFDSIIPMIERGECDAGVIIHEGRFVYRQFGLSCVCDLGEWWEKSFDLPIPLGCIALKKNAAVSQETAESLIRRSLLFSHENKDAAYRFAELYAAELGESVLAAHINLYVNEYSMFLGERGKAAVQKLEEAVQCNNLSL